MQARRLRWPGLVARIVESRVFSQFNSKLTEKRTLERSRLRWDNNLEITIKK